jgi:hypothetical protein
MKSLFGRRFPHGQIALVSILSCLLCGATASQEATVSDQRSADEEDIRESVIRKQMEDWIKDGDKNEAEAKDETEKGIAKMLNFRIFFISLNGNDPSDDFINRFHDIPRAIKKGSAAEVARVQRMPVVDKASGQRGIVFSADRIRRLGKDSAEVDGGYHCDGLCGAGIKFKVKRENGRWVVKRTKMQWIS